MSWARYHESVGEEPNITTKWTLKQLKGRRNRAFDLGAGNMRDAKYLLQQGFRKVVAIDESPQVAQYSTKGIEFHQMPIEKFVPEQGTYDFGVSCNTLFYLSRLGARRVIERAYTGLRPGGMFVGNLFGERADWVIEKLPEIDYFRKCDIDMLRTRFEKIEIEEVEWDDKAVGAEDWMPAVHWHHWNLFITKT